MARAARRGGRSTRSVFDRVPGAGRWRTALLLDGNIGIGGDPAALLRRVAELLRRDGTVLCECDAPGGGVAHGAAAPRARRGREHGSAWARVAVDAVDAAARAPPACVVATRW